VVEVIAVQLDCADCPVLGNELFRTLPAEVRERALCLFRPIELRAGTPLYVEGFPTHSIFAVRTGTCKALQATSSGREQVLRSYGAGDFVGFDALMLDRYPNTVQATTDATVCHAPRAVFLETLASAPAFTREVIRHLNRELGAARADAVSLGTQGALARVARHLLGAMAPSTGGASPRHAVLRLNRRDTAGLLGMAGESLSRQLAALEEMGVLQRRGRRLIVEDLAALERIAAA
jgi:CRP/FNR family transcriptional regulator